MYIRPRACRKRISIKRHAAAVVAGFADGAMAQLPMATAVVPMIQVFGGDGIIRKVSHKTTRRWPTPKNGWIWGEKRQVLQGFNKVHDTFVGKHVKSLSSSLLGE